MDADQSCEEVLREVICAEQEWVEAHRRLDIVALDRLMADDYRHIRADGSVFYFFRRQHFPKNSTMDENASCYKLRAKSYSWRR